jgi:hypothetical protein
VLFVRVTSFAGSRPFVSLAYLKDHDAAVRSPSHPKVWISEPTCRSPFYLRCLEATMILTLLVERRNGSRYDAELVSGERIDEFLCMTIAVGERHKTQPTRIYICVRIPNCFCCARL